MSGASQNYGKVIHAEEQYVQKTDNAEVLKIYKNKTDEEWYYKNHLGQSFPFNFNLNLKTYKVAFALPAFAGNVVPHIIQNNLGFVPVWTKTAVGEFRSQNPEWAVLGVNNIFVLVTKSSYTPVGYLSAAYSLEDGAIILRSYDSAGVLADGLIGDEDQFTRSYMEITIKS